jgi:hypothetical protein
MTLEITHYINKILDPNKDSIEIGSASKGGVIKVYGDFNNPEDFIHRLDNAIALMKYSGEAIEHAKSSNVKFITEANTTKDNDIPSKE